MINMPNFFVLETGFENLIFVLQNKFPDIFKDVYTYLNGNNTLVEIKNCPQTESDLMDFITPKISLFQEVENKINIIDLDNLKISKELINKIQTLTKESASLNIFYNSQNALLAADKKLLLTNFQEIKTDKNQFEIFANDTFQTHLGTLNIKPTQKQIQDWFKNTKSIRTTLDCMDLWQLSNAKYDPIVPDNSLPIFMYSWNLKTPNKSALQWLGVNQNDIQLALSMLYTKIAKQPNTKSLLEKIILTDKEIKNNSKISEKTQYLGLLWELSKNN